MARQPLGRGLSALLDESGAATLESSADNTTEIDLDLISPNPDQPRTRFSEDELEELTRSLRSHGIVQPIVVRRRGDRYEIVAGERRWRAAQRAELRRVPVVVREVSDEKMLELALIENIQRQELNPIEEAQAYKRLLYTSGLTQEALADRVGKSRTIIASAIRLLKLPGEIQREIETGRISAGHGRALLGTEDPKIQRLVAHSILDFALSVRETEKAVKKLSRGRQTIENQSVSVPPDPNVKAAETRLMRALNTNVKIKPASSGTGGKIEIEYYGVEDLNRIYDVILSK